MGTSEQTDEWSWEEAPEDARRRELDGDWQRMGDKREGWGGGKFSKGLSARPLQLLHYWGSAKREQGQSLRKKEHTQRQLCTVSAHKQDRADASWPAAFRKWWGRDFSPCWFLIPAQCETGVCRVNLHWMKFRGQAHRLPPTEKANIIPSTPFPLVSYYTSLKNIYIYICILKTDMET